MNDGIPKDEYLGQAIKLKYPSIDVLAKRMFEIGTQARQFKIDMIRAFRQIPTDPALWRLIGMWWTKKFYFDCMSPIGLRSAALFCQQTTNSLRYVMEVWGFFLMDYLDDLIGSEHESKVWHAFNALMQLLTDLRVGISADKTVEPTHAIEALGIWMDAELQIMSVTAERLEEIMTLLEKWRSMETCSLKQLQSLVGKLQFIAKCVHPGRVFIARLLNMMKGMKDNKQYLLTDEAREDVKWWYCFLLKFNGISLLWLIGDQEPDQSLASDACLTGCGAICGDEYFHAMFSSRVDKEATNIANKELLTVLVALRIWKHRLQGKRVVINCDNQASVACLNHGRARDVYMQKCLRAISMIGALNQFWVKAVFRWFKFTLKPPYSITHGELRLAIWDTSFWTFWLKFGHKGP